MHESKLESDAEIVSRVIAGDCDAYALLVDRYAPGIRRFLAGRGLRSMELDEVAQDVFVRVYQTLEKLREPSQFSSYLWTAVHRRFIDSRRQRSLDQVDRDLDALPEIHQGETDAAVRDALQEAIAKLPEPMQVVLGLKYGSQLTAAEIAHIVGQSTSTVTKTLSRAYDRLRRDDHLRRFWEGER